MNYTKDLFNFFRDLSANNNRQWFKDQKERYETLRHHWMDDMARLRALMIEWEPTLSRQPLNDIFYRIYRDTRFSPDKTPYKTYFSAVMSAYGRKSFHACYYFQIGIEPHESGLFGGMWCPPSPELKKVRKAIIDNIEEFEEIINAPEFKKYFPTWVGDSLKTVPNGWSKDHPYAHLLRLKDYGKAHFLNEEFFLRENWVEETSEIFRILKPFNDFLNYSIEE